MSSYKKEKKRTPADFPNNTWDNGTTQLLLWLALGPTDLRAVLVYTEPRDLGSFREKTPANKPKTPSAVGVRRLNPSFPLPATRSRGAAVT